MSRIYFDNSATTPLDPRVEEAMKPFLSDIFGNPSSLHNEGRKAREAMEHARELTATLLGARSEEVVFTASGTEADNMAIIGILKAFKGQPFHLITSAIEHPAVMEVCRYLERCGAAVTYLPVEQDGIVRPELLEQAIRPETRLISIMTANNVVGSLQPVAELGRIAHEHGILFHTDAVQAVGKIPINMRIDFIDMLSLSAHKLHGPKGVGALILRDGVQFSPLIYGGGQEGGRRSATENVAGIVGLGKAAQISSAEMREEAVHLVKLRDQLIDSVLSQFSNAYLIGHRYRRLPGHVCLGFGGLEGEAIRLLMALDDAGIAVSTGSACSSHKLSEPSYVLTAMGYDPLRARGSLRITLGRFNTQAEVEQFLDILPHIVGDMKPITTR